MDDQDAAPSRGSHRGKSLFEAGRVTHGCRFPEYENNQVDGSLSNIRRERRPSWKSRSRSYNPQNCADRGQRRNRRRAAGGNDPRCRWVKQPVAVMSQSRAAGGRSALRMKARPSPSSQGASQDRGCTLHPFVEIRPKTTLRKKTGAKFRGKFPERPDVFVSYVYVYVSSSSS
ncbi:unnamed protein product [Pleuronectes platessa]|uniref:Uncharacterized protein n=1 Tax=Pleuronectes platessa TaxID=8262 RepID=A0A9N7YYD6_PLEPL|nr:unnamed protein product [Pleuronectes platessa]